MPYLETRIRHLLREARADKGKGEAINRFNTTRCSPPPSDKLQSLDHGSDKDKYTYEFKPPPYQNDPVTRYIRQVITDLNADHISVANMNFRVSPTDKSLPFWFAIRARVGIRRVPNWKTKWFTTARLASTGETEWYIRHCRIRMVVEVMMKLSRS
jgi:hypothetical protein